MTISKLAEFDPGRRMLTDEDGNICESEFANALSVWLAAQERDGVTVAEAALAFNATPEVIRQAVDLHPWMFLAGDVIEHDGE